MVVLRVIVLMLLLLVDVVVHPRREGDADEQPLRAEDARRRLTPRLLVGAAKNAMA